MQELSGLSEGAVRIPYGNDIPRLFRSGHYLVGVSTHEPIRYTRVDNSSEFHSVADEGYPFITWYALFASKRFCYNTSQWHPRRHT